VYFPTNIQIIKMIHKPKKQRYNYYCQNCKNVIRRQESLANNCIRRCTECGSTDILREDHPYIGGKTNDVKESRKR
jgi:predicted SprT family Zn-dependent metalloprotease